MKEKQDILVSVIMCSYNTNPSFLKEAVLSILNQTYRNIELIIIDDCSLKPIVKTDYLDDERVSIIRNKTNKGPSYSRNVAIMKSKGEYIAIMDADDIAFPNRIEKEVEFLEKNLRIVAVGTWFQHVGEKTNTVEIVIDDQQYYRCCLLFGNSPTLLNPSVLIRKSVLEKYSIKYDERLRFGEDYMMWIQLSEHGQITNIKEVLMKYRIHDSQATNQNVRKTINDNLSIATSYQLKRIGVEFSESDISILINRQTKYRKIVRKKSLIDKLLLANSLSNYYEQAKLVQVCREKINDCVNSIRNPFLLFYLLFKKDYHSIANIAIKRKVKKLFGINK